MANKKGMNTGEPRTSGSIAGPAPQYPPRVDRDGLACTVGQFWSQVHGETEGSMRLVSGFLIGRRLHGITRRTYSVPGDRGLAAEWVAKEASLGRDVYMKPTLGGANGGKADVVTIAAEVDRTRLAILPRPSITLTVTPSRVQCYWRLDAPVSFSDAGALVQRLMWSQDRPMVLPGMPDNRGFGSGRFECPECLPLTYSYEQLAEVFPHVKTSGPSWEPGILRPVDLLAQRVGVITAVFGGGALRAGMASAAAAAAAIGGFLLPNPPTQEVPRPQPVQASDISRPAPSESTIAAISVAQQVSQPVSERPPATLPVSEPSESEKRRLGSVARLDDAKDEGRAQVQELRETDEVGTVLTSGGEVTRETFDRATGAIFEGPQ